MKNLDSHRYVMIRSGQFPPVALEMAPLDRRTELESPSVRIRKELGHAGAVR